MAHLPTLIKDLALILGAAGVFTLIFKKIRQPLVLGYILAGLLVGPNLDFFPTVGDPESIKVWAEIGVIFLLFSLGLEFSFKKLVRVGGTASITGIFETSMMMVFGYVTGQMMGWSMMDSIFLGGIIAISSTTIILRAFQELGLKNQAFAGQVLGILVIEDLVAVLLLVLLSTLAVSQQFSGPELLFSVVKLIFFLCLWFLAGIYILPSFLKKARKLMGPETLLVVALALCFSMVVLATQVGFSAALGAFIMGSILAETTLAEEIEHLTKSVKDLFGAVFFVSIGMLIDLHLLKEYAGPVLLIALVVIVGKVLNVTIGSLLSGQPLRQSVQSAMSLAQIGEFSFIIATLGQDLNVTSSFLYPIAVGVSVLTTFLTPYMMKLSGPFYQVLQRYIPNKWQTTLNRYSAGTQIIQAESEWKIVLRSYLSVILINSVVLVAIILLSTRFLSPFIQDQLNNPIAGAIVSVTVTLLIALPFIWALTAKRINNSAYTSLWLDSKYNHGPLVILEVVRNLLAILFLGFLLDQQFNIWVALIGAVLVIPVVVFVFRQKLQKFYVRLEKRFIRNLHERELTQNIGSNSTLTPWDAHLAYFVVNPDVDWAGEELQRLAWREDYGINIASIERGNKLIPTPKRDDRIFPFDKLGVIGTDEQLQTFKHIIEPPSTGTALPEKESQEEMRLFKIIVDENTRLKGKSIRDSGIREKTHGLVVGVERKGNRILNPPSEFVFEWDDVIWLVGDRKLPN